MNRANLEKLAAYLEALPADYRHFDMSSYFLIEGRGTVYADYYAGRCGTVACAVGHGPAAGIPSLVSDEYWTEYADRVFDLTEEEFTWCFDGAWSIVDDTHHGAAKRIRHLLEHGVPDNAEAQLRFDVPYLFAQEPAE